MVWGIPILIFLSNVPGATSIQDSRVGPIHVLRNPRFWVFCHIIFLSFLSEIFSVNVPSQSMPHLEIENLLETDVNTMRITMNVPKRKTRAKTVENAGKIFTLFIFFHKEQKRFLVTLKRKMYLFEGKQCTLSLTTHIAVKY